MKTYWRKTDIGTLEPEDEATIEWLSKRPVAGVVSGDLVTPRNYEHLQKFMCLVRLVHTQLPEPEPVRYQGRVITPEWSQEHTRHHLTVQAGYYHVIGLPNGKVRIEPKSIAFASMSQDEFEEFYSDAIDAALKILPREWDAEKLNEVAMQVVGYV